MNQEFKMLLRKGLGRTYTYIEKYGDSDIKQTLLDACIDNACYDPLVEGSRAAWLLTLIDLTQKPDFYFMRMIDAFNSGVRDDSHQLNDLICLIAQRDVSDAKKALYQRFNLHFSDKSLTEFTEYDLCCYGDALIAVDNLEGLKHIATFIGEKLSAYPEGVHNEAIWSWFWLFAYKDISQNDVMRYLEDQAHANRNIDAFFKVALQNKDKVLQAHEALITFRKKRRDYIPKINNILTMIEGEHNSHSIGVLSHFGAKYATEEELSVLLNKLIEEERKDRLRKYLLVFLRRPFPFLNQKLFELAASSDDLIRMPAITALSNNQDDEIRTLAIQLCKEKVSAAVKLFVHNYKSGDFKYFEPLLHSLTDEKDIHDACEAVLAICLNFNSELQSSLLWVYENSPCSSCRGESVKILIENHVLPELLKFECQYDCNEETRALSRLN